MKITELYLVLEDGEDFDEADIVGKDELADYAEDTDYKIYKLNNLVEVKVRLEVVPVKKAPKKK